MIIVDELPFREYSHTLNPKFDPHPIEEVEKVFQFEKEKDLHYY